MTDAELESIGKRARLGYYGLPGGVKDVSALVAEVLRLRKREEELYGEDYDKLHTAVWLAEAVLVDQDGREEFAERYPMSEETWNALDAYRRAKVG